MPRLTLLLMLLITASHCAGRRAAPPKQERCLTLSGHLRCRATDGAHFSVPYTELPGKTMRECRPVTDAEAQANFEAALNGR